MIVYVIVYVSPTNINVEYNECDNISCILYIKLNFEILIRNLLGLRIVLIFVSKLTLFQGAMNIDLTRLPPKATRCRLYLINQ